VFTPYLLAIRRWHGHNHRGLEDVVAAQRDVWWGPGVAECDARRLQERGVTAIVDLAAEHDAPRAFVGLRRHDLPLLDFTTPRPEELEAAVWFIADARGEGIVYVHCALGRSRSAAVMAAWFAWHRSGGDPTTADVERAVADLQLLRPRMVLTRAMRMNLASWAEKRQVAA